MKPGLLLFRSAALPLVLLVLAAAAARGQEMAPAGGYRGIWYFNQPTKDQYAYKYSGGLGTYCMKHIPMAVYSPEADRTFFVFGGASDTGSLLETVACYDHATGRVSNPLVLMDKKTDDAHDNPVISLDDTGHVWVFASSHGTARPSFLFKSVKPYDISAFDRVWETNFSYPQPWWVKGKGFFFLHTRYAKGRGLWHATSPDGLAWSDPKPLSFFGEGHYQVSWPCGDRVGTAFDYHPKGKGLNFRTNLYYLETADMGATWRNARGETVPTPLDNRDNPALVRDYEAEGLLVYVKDVNYDAEGRPAVLYVTSRGWQPGPQNGPHTWRVARWTGREWAFSDVAVADNNYDSGSLYTEDPGKWRVIGPTEPGPQPFTPGGEIALWTSTDGGAAWARERMVTGGSVFNHTHARRPLNAHPDFYAYWADGNTLKPSESSLYFCDRDGKTVRRLPRTMTGDWATPELVAPAK